MDSLAQSSPQASQASQVTQQSPIVTPMEVPQPSHNAVNDSSVTSGVSVSMSANIISANVSEGQNSSAVSSSVPSASATTSLVTQGTLQTSNTPMSPQLIVSSSQPHLVASTQSANGLLGQSLANSITSVANQAMQMSQTVQTSQMQPLLQTSVQPTGSNQMSVTMSPLPQVQVIQQPLGATTGTYQLQQVYPQGMILPGNLTIQNMPFGTTNQGLSLQIPFSGTGGVSSGTMPITSIAAKPPIMSKGVAISPLSQAHHNMISPLKPSMGPPGAQFLKQVLPTQQFVPHSAANQTVVISQILPQPNQHSLQQSILPANANKLLETPKGKPFGTGSVRSAFGNKMLSHSGAIQPKSPILPATSMATSMASPLMANSHFKNPFAPNQNATQLIATQTPSNLITNPQILGSFQTIGPGLTWTTSPQSTHLVAPNGSPIFIRGPTQGGEHMFISTSNMSNMSSPQIQAVSMPTPISVHNPISSPMQVNAVTSQPSCVAQVSVNASPQPIPINSTVQSIATTVVTPSQTTAVTSTPVPSNITKSKRQASSVATQTMGQSTAQKVESTTNLKPIAPAKPKSNAQHSAAIKAMKESAANTTTARATSVGTTQTAQPTPVPLNCKPPNHTNKSDAGNQTTKISVAIETPKPNSLVSSTRATEHNKQSREAKNSSNVSTETKDHKVVNSGADAIKTTVKKPAVEKKDASTEQDNELSTNFFAQTNHKSVQNSIHCSNGSNISNANCQVNGQQIAVLSDLNRQDISKPQKAIVKPQKSQILTHVIDGYIIQESANPFPVNGIGYSSESRTDGMDGIETLKAKTKNENSNTNASSSKNRTNSDRHLCMNCGLRRKTGTKGSRGLKRFCSQSCSDKFALNKNSSSGARLVLHNLVTGHLETTDIQRSQDIPLETINDLEKPFDDKKKVKNLKRTHENPVEITIPSKSEKVVNETTHKSGPTASEASPLVNCVPPTAHSAEESSNSVIAGLYIPPGGRNPLQWTVNDVYEFVRNLQGCTEYADEFRSQEIDGQALMLIKEDHLMNTMNMKLGPALKICSKINALREDAQKQS